MSGKLGRCSNAADRELHKSARSGRLHDLDADRHQRLARPHRSILLMRAEVLGPHTEYDFAPSGETLYTARVRSEFLAGRKAEDRSAILDLDPAGNEVHLRRTEEPCNKARCGTLE